MVEALSEVKKYDSLAPPACINEMAGTTSVKDFLLA